MAAWQKRARAGVAIVGVVSAVAVYVAYSGRRGAPPPTPIHRVAPEAIAEAFGSLAKRFGKGEIGQLEAESWQQFENGTKFIRVKIRVPKGERTFTVTADEAFTGTNEVEVELKSNVRLEDSDGFWLLTDRGTFNQDTYIATVPGSATFGKGRMSGSGTNLTYDQKNDVLSVLEQAQITTVNEANAPVMQFTSEKATLDRLQHRLVVDSNAHVVRESQVIDSNHAEAALSETNDIVTLLQLRGDSRVTGGESSIDAMRARDIDLDYTDDGATLEAVKLAGDSAIGMTGSKGQPGRQIAGDTVDLTLAADGSLTQAVARRKVRLDLPAAADGPQRSITADALDATGQPGKGLTDATFTANVTFVEEPTRGSGETSGARQGSRRTAHAQKLDTRLADDAVQAATFTGEVTFEETGLKACAARLEYEPERGTLALSGATKEGRPMVAEEEVAIEAPTIDVALETRHMTAKGGQTTWMRSAMKRCRPSTARPAGEQGERNVPGLLKSDAAVTITSPELEYDSRTGYATYSGGRTRLEQEKDTMISSDLLVIDQSKGNLAATGNAVSQLMVDEKSTQGRAPEIRYTDADRRVRYTVSPKEGAATPPGAAANEVSLVSTDTNIRARAYIELRLAPKENKVERMDARNSIRVAEGTRVISGGAEMVYLAAAEKYEIKAGGTTPVTIVERQGATCRENSGKSVTFFKGKKNVIIDGNELSDTSTAPSKGTCAAGSR